MPKYYCEICDFRTVRFPRLTKHIEVNHKDYEKLTCCEIRHADKKTDISELIKNSHKFSKLPIYWINMDRSKDRRETMEKLFKLINVKNYRISAYDGMNIDKYHNINFNSNITLLEKGCTLSHFKSIKTAFDNDDKYAVIMEDDITIDHIGKWELSLKQIIDYAPKEWEIIKLHCISFGYTLALIKKSKDSLYSKWESRSSSTGVYIINKKGMKKIIEKFYIDGEWTINEDDAVADKIIYSTVSTYDYTRPIFTHEVKNSTIHTNHMKYHIRSLNVINDYYYEEIYLLNKLKYGLSGYKVYWINLDRSPIRRENMVKNFKSYNIKNFRISAYDGKIIDKYDEIEYETDRSPYEIGCTLSHLKSIKTSHDNNDNIAIIMEDDITFDHIDKWIYSMKKIIDDAPNDWEIIKLHCIYAKHINKLVKRFRTQKLVYSKWETRSVGTGCYVINRKGMKNIIEQYYKNGKWKIYHKLPIADNLIYTSVKTYDYTIPMFTHRIKDSTIHSEYLNSHKDALVAINNYYAK